jgi:ABC-type transport system involved in multi-copper enzyme maturation permease subunit
MLSVLKYILLTAIRDKLYAGLFIILLAAFGVSCALADASLVEKAQATTVYIAGSSRMIFAIGMILFVCFYVRKSFENREVEFILAKPISRHKLILAYLLGFILVSALIILPLTILLLFMKANKIGLLYWSTSLLFEALIIITFSILAALILKSAVPAVLASLGFYILSRMMGFFVLTVKIPQSASDFESTNRILHIILKAISVVFPRLDLYSKSDWLIYGMSNFSDFYIVLGQSLIYIPLMIFMAFYDFNRKQF